VGRQRQLEENELAPFVTKGRRKKEFEGGAEKVLLEMKVSSSSEKNETRKMSDVVIELSACSLSRRPGLFGDTSCER